MGRKTLLVIGACLMAVSLGMLAALGWQYVVYCYHGLLLAWLLLAWPIVSVVSY